MRRAACALLVLSAGCLLAPPRSEIPSRASAQDAATPAPVTSAGTAAVVLVAGEVLGNLEPCNCVDGMAGGFPRRLAALARERQQGGGAGVDIVHLERGDLSGDDPHPRLVEARTRAAFELLAGARAAAVAVGERDLRLGARALRRLADDAGVALLAANLRDPSTGRRPFEASRMVEAGGRRLLITAVLDPELGDPTGTLAVGDPAAAVREVIATVEAPVGGTSLEPPVIIVVLFHGTAARAREALGADLPIDLVLAGHDVKTEAPVERLGHAVLASTVRDARALVRVTLRATPRVEGEADPHSIGEVSSLPLDGRIPDDPWARDRVERYYREARDLPEPPRKRSPDGGALTGSQACADCHVEAHEKLLATKHHGAYARIVDKDPARAGLFECIGCHVVGHGFEGGFTSVEATPHLAEVGCESCHGVGGNHVADGGGRGYGVKAGFPESWRATCVGCHDASNSPGFDFTRDLERIKHWSR